MEVCQRCLSKPISFQCTVCPSYRNLCTRCDNIIHNISSKQDHRRIAINQTKSSQELKQENNILDNKINLNNSAINPILHANLDFDNDYNNNNQQKMNSIGIEQNDQISNINNITGQNNNLLISQMRKSLNDYNNDNLNDNIDNNKMNMNNNSSLQIGSLQGGLLNQGTSINSNLLIADNYSKEYVNEIKKVFEKEKQILEYKNKSLQYSLNKIKLEFSDQINNLSKQLEDNQNSNILNINTLKENYETKISNLTQEHNNEIKLYSQNINQLESELNKLKECYTSEIKEKNSLIIELKNENERLNIELKEKNDELYKIKNSFEIMTKQYEKEYNEEKSKIINEYESKIGEIVANVENSKNNLVNLIEKREFDMKNILNEKNAEINNLNEMNNIMKQELEKHKINLVNIRNNKDNLYQENINLKKELHKLDCDSQLQSNEILRIQEENQILLDENNRLKLELNKLDTIIYSNNNVEE